MPKTLTAWLDQAGSLSSAVNATADDDGTPTRPQRRRATLTNKVR